MFGSSRLSTRPPGRALTPIGISIIGALVALAGSAAFAAAEPEPLTLDVRDADAVPGGRLAVVLRTYSPRGVGQGQICLGFQAQRAPLGDLVEAQVFNPSGDAQYSVDFDQEGGEIVLDFSSVTGDINAVDGPVAVIYFDIDGDAEPGTEFELTVDLANTALLDSQGQTITLDADSGRMRIRSPADPIDVTAEGGEVSPGRHADIQIETEQSLELSSGRLVVSFDPSIAAGTPVVTHDDRHGEATFTADTSQAGVVDIVFSGGQDFNRLPGALFSVRVPIRSDAVLGAQSVVSFGGATSLIDMGGESVALDLEGEPIVVVAEEPLFADGFENGDLGAWCGVVP